MFHTNLQSAPSPCGRLGCAGSPSIVGSMTSFNGEATIHMDVANINMYTEYLLTNKQYGYEIQPKTGPVFCLTEDKRAVGVSSSNTDARVLGTVTNNKCGFTGVEMGPFYPNTPPKLIILLI